LEERMASFKEQARSFSFFRLIYLLERTFPEAPRIGHTGPAKREMIRVRGETSLVFSPSDVTDFDYVRYADGERRARVDAAFLGLYGSVSPIPPHFAEEIALAAYQDGPQPVRELLDVIHHRLFSL